MTAGRPTEMGVSGFALDIIDCLQDAFEKLEAGHEQDIISDPFYTPKQGPLSDEKVDQLISEIDREFAIEIDNYPTYHERRSGANAKPEFSRLGPSARRALAEGLMRVIEDHDAFTAKNVAALSATAEPPTAYDC